MVHGGACFFAHLTKSINSREKVEFVWTSVGGASIMLAVGSANLTLLAASLVCRLPLPLSAVPPGGPPFLAPFFAAPKAMVGLCLFPIAGDAPWERSFIVAI